MVMLPEARVPNGLRVYAIGDVHGCLDALTAVHERIEDDLVQRPIDDWRIIHLGDYVDRGPDSRGVIARLADMLPGGRVYALRGNHDQYFLDFLAAANTPSFEPWTLYGGLDTLASYGVLPKGSARNAYARESLHEAVVTAVPPAHQRFLAALPHMLRIGGYAFVHAGVRPGTPLTAQTAHDLIWMREPFLSAEDDHGAVVVHGHTPVRSVTVRANRIAIDTGAVYGGALSCLMLEGSLRAVLGPNGPVPIA